MRVLVLLERLLPHHRAVWCALAELGVELHLGVAAGDLGEAMSPDLTQTIGSGHIHPMRTVGLRGDDPLWWIQPGLPRLIRGLQPDLVHLQAEPWALRVFPASRAATCLVGHGAETMWSQGGRVERGIRSAVARRNLQRLGGYVGWNTAAVTQARGHGLPTTAPTHIFCPELPDPGVFRPDTARREATRKAMGLKGFVFGFVGRLVPEKGLTWLIAAMDQVAGGEDADLTLAVFGDGPQRGVLEAAARSRPWLSVRGVVEPRELPAVMRSLDVLILPSLTTDAVAEQFGKVVVEAMMSGTPVITSTAGSLPEVTAGAAVLVAEQDTAGLADAMRRMRDEPLHRQQLVERANARNATFDPSTQAQQLWAFWQHCRDAQVRAASAEGHAGAD